MFAESSRFVLIGEKKFLSKAIDYLSDDFVVTSNAGFTGKLYSKLQFFALFVYVKDGGV